MQRLARELDSRDSKGLAGATLGRVNSPPTEQPMAPVSERDLSRVAL